MSELEHEHHHNPSTHEKTRKVIEQIIRDWAVNLEPEVKANMDAAAFKEGAYDMFKKFALEHQAHPDFRHEGDYGDDLLFDGNPTDENLWDIYRHSGINPDDLFSELILGKKIEPRI